MEPIGLSGLANVEASNDFELERIDVDVHSWSNLVLVLMECVPCWRQFLGDVLYRFALLDFLNG